MIGVSIQNLAFRENNKELLAQHDCFEEYILSLKSKGVDSIEIRKLPRKISEEDFDLINASIEKIWLAGMQITIHGDLTGEKSGDTFLEIYPSMEYILKNFQKYQNKIVMTLHALQEPSKSTQKSQDELKEETISMLEKWVKLVEEENIPVYFALENNRSKDKSIDPGNSCKVVTEMVQRVNSRHLGVCWDMGHLFSNLNEERELSMTMGELPSEDFLKRVIHTHIHALNDDGRTHFPLTEEFKLPIDVYVKALQEQNYNGVYNLELSFDRFAKEAPVAEQVFTSINRLKELQTVDV